MRAEKRQTNAVNRFVCSSGSSVIAKNSINQALESGFAAFQRGALLDARRILRNVKHPKAIHLMGLIEKRDGNLDLAITLLQTAANLDPQDVEIASNLASCASDVGNAKLALSEYRRALNIQSDFMPAVTGLGQLLTVLKRYDAALQLYQEQAKLTPDDSAVRHGIGTALLGLGRAEDAADIFDKLINEGNEDAAIHFMRGRARLEMAQLDEAVADLRIAHAAQPDTMSLEALANIYWMQQDNAAFNALLKEAVKTPELSVATAEILRRTGAADTALQVLNNNGAANYEYAAAWRTAATAHIDLQQADKAEIVARRRLGVDPDDRSIKQSLISSLLMQGKAAEALSGAEELRQEDPADQLWIAYEATALRLLDSPRYDQIVDLERLVRSYTLQPPSGFDTLADFNTALRLALEKWQQFQSHPLGQSLRDGSQTPRDLTSIDDPVIRAFFSALDEPIRDYIERMGNADDHPLTVRNTGDYRFAGSWSVKLHGGGRHVNHVHPEGWISSSYYVAVPEETQKDPNKAGWIKFGEPPFTTQPSIGPQKWVEPKAGMLVLFPSYLWHGTQPIHDNAVRITAPFDVVPV